MTRPLKMFLGALTAWPLVYIALFICIAIFSALFLASSGVGEGSEPPIGLLFGFGTLFIIHILTILLTLILLVFYIVHMFKNNSVPQDKKIFWLLGFFFCGIFVQLAYWYTYIWCEPVSNDQPLISA